MIRICFLQGVLIVAASLTLWAQPAPPQTPTALPGASGNNAMQTTDDWNRRLQQLVKSTLANAKGAPSPGDYRIGPNDQLSITVVDAPDLSNPVRVAADGDISMPLLGTVKAAGLTPHELALLLEALLRRTYMKDPHVAVTVTEVQSHGVSVLGAVKNPGVYQIRGTKTLLEMLSLAGGLAPEAGDAVLVMRGANAEFVPQQGPQIQTVSAREVSAPKGSGEADSSSTETENSNTVEISLKRLLDSGDPKYNVPIYPGDIVKVKAAGIVYVVGDVRRPGGFPVQDNEHITVLQAIALGEGLAPTASKDKAAIIRMAQNGQQIELPIHLGRILSGKAPDIALRSKDVLFIPKSGAKSAGRAALDTFARWIVWRGIP